MSSLPDKHQRLSQLRPLAPAAVRSLAEAWDVRMVYESNSIEGNTLTLRETEILHSTDATSPGKTVADHRAAKQLHKAWLLFKSKASKQLEPTEDDLLKVYEMLTGRQRVGNDSFLIAASSRIAALAGGSCFEVETMGDLFFGLPHDPFQKACALHHRITSRKRFDESSGQIGRLAMNFVLLAAGYPPVSISPQLRTDYYAALEAADSGDFPTWQAFLTNRLHEEFDFWLTALTEPTATN